MKIFYFLLISTTFSLNCVIAQSKVSDHFKVGEYFAPGTEYTVKKFFFPEYKPNRADYYNVDDNGQKMRLTRSLCYIDVNKVAYYVNEFKTQVLELQKLDGKTTSAIVQNLQVRENEISVISSKNLLSGAEKLYNTKKKILLKLPKGPGQIISWSEIEQDGTTINNDAKYVVYEDNIGIPYLAIQVKTVANHIEINRIITTTSLYISGIGYFKTTIYDKTKQTFVDFESLNGVVYDATVNDDLLKKFSLNNKTSENISSSDVLEADKNQFCYGVDYQFTPNYKKLVEYLKTHTSPCPSKSRGQWAKEQFRRLGERIVKLHDIKPQQAASIMTEYNELLAPYITTEAYTGFNDDSDFRKCIEFLYNIDSAIDTIKKSN